MPTPTKATAASAASHTGGNAHHPLMPRWMLQLGGLGLFLVAIVDSSPIPLAIPGSTDLLLLLLVSHKGNPFLLAACAVAGSAVGGYTTWIAGKKGGEALLKHSVPPRFRSRMEHWVEHHSILSVMLPALLPPPIPLTPFLLAAGALGISFRRYVVSLVAARTIRYGLVAWAGVVYGRTFIHWWTRTLAGWSGIIEWTFFIVLIGGTGFGFWQYQRQRRAAQGERAFA